MSLGGLEKQFSQLKKLLAVFDVPLGVIPHFQSIQCGHEGMGVVLGQG